MTKKIIIGSVIFLLIAIGVAYYLIFIKSPTPTVENPPTPSSFFPLDTGTNTNTGGGQGTDPIKSQYEAGEPRLLKLSSEPVSGITSYQTATSTTVVRYAERATSHILDIIPSTGTVQKIANTTIPNIQEALWTASQNSLVLRFIENDQETIGTYLAEIVPPRNTASLEATRELQVAFLPKNIDSITLSPNGQKIFSLAHTNDGAQGIISDTDGGKAVTIFTSPINSWLADWSDDTAITLTSKPSHSTNGTSYILNTAGGIRKIFGNVPGLTVLTNPTASHIAYAGNNGALYIRNIKTGDTINPSINTLPEKCIWSQRDITVMYCAVPESILSNQLPDVWYKGQITFNDRLFRINTTSGVATEIANLQSDYGQSIDGINLKLSQDEKYLFFINKKDYTGWSFKINL